MARTSGFLYFLLAVGGGIFGVHNFYAGRTRRAVCQLLLTVLSCGFLSGITLLWVIGELIFCSPEKSKRRIVIGCAGILIAVGVLAALILGGLMFYGFKLEQSCRLNITNIISQLHLYAEEHGGNFPKGENDIGFLELGIAPEWLICPVSGEQTYVYLGGANTTDFNNCPILFEFSDEHELATVVYCTGSLSSEKMDISCCESVYDVLVQLERQAYDETVKEFLRQKQELYR